MKQQKQSGFAHLVILTVVLGILLAGTLSFVYYQNFIKKNDTVTKTDDSSKTNDKVVEKPAVVSTNKLYSDAMFSFEYPKTGWTAGEGGLPSSVSLTTLDYEVGPMGAEKGSSVLVSWIKYYDSAAEMIASYKAKGLISKVDNTTVDGQAAYRYTCYEFCSSEVAFDKAGTGYTVSFISANGTNSEVYETVLKTLKVK